MTRRIQGVIAFSVAYLQKEASYLVGDMVGESRTPDGEAVGAKLTLGDALGATVGSVVGVTYTVGVGDGTGAGVGVSAFRAKYPKTKPTSRRDSPSK